MEEPGEPGVPAPPAALGASSTTITAADHLVSEQDLSHGTPTAQPEKRSEIETDPDADEDPPSAGVSGGDGGTCAPVPEGAAYAGGDSDGEGDLASGLGTSVGEVSRPASTTGAPATPPLHSTPPYKIALCRYWAKDGGCAHGTRCTFAHGEQEIRRGGTGGSKPAAAVAAAVLNAGQPVAKPHLVKTQLCRHFMRRGFCAHGTKCAFAHGKDELRRLPEEQRDRRVCTFWMEGTCKNGSSCRFTHGFHDQPQDFCARSVASSVGGASYASFPMSYEEQQAWGVPPTTQGYASLPPVYAHMHPYMVPSMAHGQAMSHMIVSPAQAPPPPPVAAAGPLQQQPSLEPTSSDASIAALLRATHPFERSLSLGPSWSRDAEGSPSGSLADGPLVLVPWQLFRQSGSLPPLAEVVQQERPQQAEQEQQQPEGGQEALQRPTEGQIEQQRQNLPPPLPMPVPSLPTPDVPPCQLAAVAEDAVEPLAALRSAAAGIAAAPVALEPPAAPAVQLQLAATVEASLAGACSRPSSRAGTPVDACAAAEGGCGSVAGGGLLPPDVGALLQHSVRSLLCPLTQEPFQDPVVAADGNIYERCAIEAWLYKEGRDSSPLTKEPLPHKMLMPCATIQRCAEEVRSLVAALRQPAA